MDDDVDEKNVKQTIGTCQILHQKGKNWILTFPLIMFSLMCVPLSLSADSRITEIKSAN